MQRDPGCKLVPRGAQSSPRRLERASRKQFLVDKVCPGPFPALQLTPPIVGLPFLLPSQMLPPALGHWPCPVGAAACDLSLPQAGLCPAACIGLVDRPAINVEGQAVFRRAALRCLWQLPLGVYRLTEEPQTVHKGQGACVQLNCTSAHCDLNFIFLKHFI